MAARSLDSKLYTLTQSGSATCCHWRRGGGVLAVHFQSGQASLNFTQMTRQRSSVDLLRMTAHQRSDVSSFGPLAAGPGC